MDRARRYGGVPLDPDPTHTGPRSPADAAPHTEPLLLAAVFAGGLVGTPVRYAVGLALPARAGGWPTGTFLVNLVGAFLLGLLVEELARRGPDRGRRRVLRLGLGAGLLGAFTTYSTLAVETDLLVRDHRAALAATYALSTVLAGLVLAATGITLAAARHRRRTAPSAA